MASESRGAFLSTIGEGLRKLGPQYAGMKQMEYENLAELAKRDRIESFEIMKMGMSDQMSREQLGIKHGYDMGLVAEREKQSAKYRVGNEVKVPVKYGLEEYSIVIQDRVDEAGVRTWWMFNPMDANPQWKPISDAEKAEIISGAASAGTVGSEVDEGPLTLDQAVRSYATKNGMTIAQSLEAYRSAVSDGTLTSVTIADIDDLESQYTSDELGVETSGLSDNEATAANVAGVGTTIVVQQILKKLTPWKWAKRWGVGAVAGLAMDLGIRQWLKDNGIKEADLPDHWKSEVNDLLDGDMKGMSNPEIIGYFQMVLDGQGLEHGQRDAIIDVLKERGIDTSSFSAAPSAAPPEPQTTGTESVTTAEPVPELDEDLSQEAETILENRQPWFQAVLSRVVKETGDGALSTTAIYSVLTQKEIDKPGLVEAILFALSEN